MLQCNQERLDVQMVREGRLGEAPRLTDRLIIRRLYSPTSAKSPSIMTDTAKVLQELWMRFALSVECRDKFLRAVFLGSKMIANYAEGNLSEDSKERLSLIQGTVSTSRKAFR